MRLLPLKPNGKDPPLTKDLTLSILINFPCRNNTDDDETVFALNAENQDIMLRTVDRNPLTLQARALPVGGVHLDEMHSTIMLPAPHSPLK